MLSMHREIPVLALPDVTGRSLSTWSYKQEQPLVLVFAGSFEPLLAEFAQRYPDYRATNAEVIAVVRLPPSKAQLPFPVMVDVDGSTTSQYVGEPPTVLVTDAFGVLEGRFEGPHPDHDGILGLLSALEMRCPECGVAEWPEED